MERERLRFTLGSFEKFPKFQRSKIKANAFYCRMSAALTDRYGKDKRFLEIMQSVIEKSRNEKKIRRFWEFFILLRSVRALDGWPVGMRPLHREKPAVSRSAESRKDENEERHSVAADGRLPAGDGLRVRGAQGPCGACVPFGVPARRSGPRGRACVLRLRTPFDRGRTLYLPELRRRRTPYSLHGHRPASRTRRRVPVSGPCSFPAQKGRRTASAFRAGGRASSRGLPRPSRIGLKLPSGPMPRAPVRNQF